MEVAVLEPLTEAEQRDASEWAQHYPYRWRMLQTGDTDALVKQVETLGKAPELAILLEGTYVYGFLRGEGGVHRRNEQRPSGERTQQLVETSVAASGQEIAPYWLDYLLQQRSQDVLKKATVMGRKAAARTAAPEVVRVYQFDGQRHVRDLRTKVRNNNLDAVLAGDLDDFILAYLRETEAETAWDEPEDEAEHYKG